MTLKEVSDLIYILELFSILTHLPQNRSRNRRLRWQNFISLHSSFSVPEMGIEVLDGDDSDDDNDDDDDDNYNDDDDHDDDDEDDDD